MEKYTPVQTLKTGWRLIHDPGDAGRAQKGFLGIPETGAVDAEVPGFVHMYLPDCPGIAWYQKRFTLDFAPDELHAVTLDVGMADFLCEIYLNGSLVGLHRGTENPFRFDVSRYLRPAGEENLLVARVSKPYTKDVDGYSFREIPHRNQLPEGLRSGSCYNVYGIHGEVTLKRVPKVRITDLFVNGNVETNRIDVEATVQNDFDQETEARLTLLAGLRGRGFTEASDESRVLACPGETVVRRSIPLSEVRLWDLDEPNLYTVYAALETEKTSHSAFRDCGFRVFKVNPDGYFSLNGKRLFLKSSHTGNCMPESTQHLSRDKSLIRRDFLMAKAAGFNCVRFISGAALPEQLDICDEIGLMVYEEPCASWLLGDGPRAKELYLYDLLTMIRRDRSHPSVTIWGLLNEIPSEEPLKDGCMAAREALPALREMDETRLVLYSSGRWDNEPRVGSFANPHSKAWQYGWGGEGENAPERVARGGYPLPDPYPPVLGDKHIYPRQPHSRFDIQLMRTMGAEEKRPVFLSEYGVGSLFDVLWLKRKFEQTGADRRMPDVKLVFETAELFEKDLRDYKMENEYAFPSDIMEESHEMHAKHRRMCFDIVRSNPYINGYSITGLLDHSVCGEGLWTLMREWKKGIADVLQDGFSHLRWCLFVSDLNVYAGRAFTVEGVLANEDVLKARAYRVKMRIFGQQGAVWEDETTLDVTDELLKGLAVPVFKREIVLNVPEGEYTLCAEIESGAAATGGRRVFHVTEDEKTRAEVNEIVGVALPENVKAFLRRKGVRVVGAENAKGKAVVLAGTPDDKKTAWDAVRALLARGSRVIAADRAFLVDGDEAFLLGVDVRLGDLQRGSTDWLYHNEYLLRRGHPYFRNLPTGLLDWEYYLALTSGVYFRDREEEKAKDVAAICFHTGDFASPTGYSGGMQLATYAVNGGEVVASAFRILENVGSSPAADRLLLNMLNEEYKRLNG